MNESPHDPEGDRIAAPSVPPTPVQYSGCAVACWIVSCMGWISMLTYTVHGETYAILEDGEARLAAGGFFAGASLILFLLALPSLRAGRTRGWLLAGFGLGVTCLLLSIVVPLLLILASS